MLSPYLSSHSTSKPGQESWAGLGWLLKNKFYFFPLRCAEIEINACQKQVLSSFFAKRE